MRFDLGKMERGEKSSKMQACLQAGKPRKQPRESVCEDKGIATRCNSMLLSPMAGGRNRKKNCQDCITTVFLNSYKQCGGPAGKRSQQNHAWHLGFIPSVVKKGLSLPAQDPEFSVIPAGGIGKTVQG